MQKLLITIIQGYRLFLSPFLGNNCRFYPSCSCYAQEAIKLHGVFKGSWYAVRRIFRCHPFCEGGVDLVPGSNKKE